MLRDVIKLFEEIGVTAGEVDAAVNSPEIREAMREKADEVKTYWQSISPVFGDRQEKRADPPEGEPGEYRDSIQIIEGEVIRVGTEDEKAKWIEYGTAHMPEYAPAQKTVDHFNGRDGTVEAG